jgi:chaperone required for assembly of F1-ATPase
VWVTRIGESEACLEGLRLTAEWVKQSTLVESDRLNLTREVQKPIDTRTNHAEILVEIKGAMILLSNCKVRHVLREQTR